MKKNIQYKWLVFMCFCLAVLNVRSQQVNTMYFMDNVPVRHYLNPAFQPYSDFYLGMPVLGFTQFGVSNNSLTLKDFVYNQNGQTITFLHPDGNKDKFYNALRPTTLMNANVQINLFDFGFRTGNSFWSFSLTQKAEGNVGIPKDFMKLLLYGTPDKVNNVYDFKTFGFNATMYTEAALGYSKKINDKLSVGGKFKFLLGNTNTSMSNQNLMLNAGIEEWTLKGAGEINYAGVVKINGDSIHNFEPEMPASRMDFLKPAGMGAGIDIGATYKPIRNLTVSAALTDFGMIRWNLNAKNVKYDVDYKYIGIDSLSFNSNWDMGFIADSIINGLSNSLNDTITNSAYSTRTSPKLNVGLEYSFFNDKLSLGLLSRTIFQNKTIFEELTASVNGRPVDWFNMSLSYSIMNGRMSNIGAGLGLRVGFINYFFTADYIPLNYAPIKLKDIDAGMPNFTLPIAYNTKGLNFAVGLNMVFGNRKDKDKDGVVDRKDKCPETPFSVIVDKYGCPVDTDGDGVPDYLDKCARTPPEAYNRIDQNGCPVDSDGDGVPDYLDQCPDTPIEAIGFVDEKGCELDSDKDGVFDYMDKCPETPEGVKVDSVGCPHDSDGDGVYDYLDLCPETPVQAHGMVDKNGCPLDTDTDGVPDYLDLCPNTPLEALGFVDRNGCTLDSDDDGVPDYLDKCPDTPVEARGMVDQNGCPRDTDGDGVFDYLDNCPKVPGVASNKGCPEIKTEVKTLFQKALQGIQFETGKDQIRTTSHTILNQIAKVLIDNPTYLIEVRGHTDNVGKMEMNMDLSERRALSVRNYLISKGVDEKRMTSNGFGDTLPVASNKTAAGRTLNRRVEFIVSFEEVTYE
jgi:outer membrane protein OmpA-like peptidoglycan-associated protein